MNYVAITGERQAKDLLRDLQDLPGPFGLDCETIGVDPTSESPAHRGSIYCWSLATTSDRRITRDGVGTYLDCDAYYVDGKLLPMFGPWLATAPVVGHNIHGFDRHMFANHGIELTRIVGDTLRMHKLLRPSTDVKHGLKALARYWLGVEQPDYASLFSRPKHNTTTQNSKMTRRKICGKFVPTLLGDEVSNVYASRELIPLNEIATNYPQRLSALYAYASADAKLTLELYQLFRDRLLQQPWEAAA